MLARAQKALLFRTGGTPAAFSGWQADRQGDIRPLSSENDGDLVPRCRRGDEAAWRELVARHTRRVFAVAYRFTGRVDEAVRRTHFQSSLMRLPLSTDG